VSVLVVFILFIYYKKSSATAEGTRDELSVEILSTASRLYDKSHLKWIAAGE